MRARACAQVRLGVLRRSTPDSIGPFFDDAAVDTAWAWARGALRDEVRVQQHHVAPAFLSPPLLCPVIFSTQHWPDIFSNRAPFRNEQMWPLACVPAVLFRFYGGKLFAVWMPRTTAN